MKYPFFFQKNRLIPMMNSLNLSLVSLLRRSIAVLPTANLPTVNVILFSLFATFASAQGWQHTFGGSKEDAASAVVATLDGGYATLGFSESFGSVAMQMYLIKTDAYGKQQWAKSYGGQFNDLGNDLVQTADGGFILAGYSNISGAPVNNQMYIVRTDALGNTVWQKYFGGAQDDKAYGITATSDGNYLISGIRQAANNDYNAALVKINGTGDLLWQQNYGGGNAEDYGRNAIELQGNYYLLGHTAANSNKNMFLVKTDTEGNGIGFFNYGGTEIDEGYDLVATKDTCLLLVGKTNNNSDASVIKVDTKGKELWSKNYGGEFEDEAYTIALCPDGNYVIGGFTLPDGINNKGYLLKINPKGDLLWEKRLNEKTLYQAINGVIATDDGSIVAAGTIGTSTDLLFNIFTDATLIKTDANGVLPSNYILGKVYKDNNDNCQYDATETTLGGWRIEAKGKQKTYLTNTDALGRYQFVTDTGTYQIRVITPNDYWQSCLLVANVSLLAIQDSVTRNFGIKPVTQCAYLQVTINTPQLRRCQSNPYQVNYCNLGTETAKKVKIVVELDDYLTYKGVSGGVTLAASKGNVYTFQANDLPPGTCEGFEIIADLDCNSTILGQTHCVRARIFPDSICTPPNPKWDGSSVKVTGKCTGTEIVFEVKNIGTKAMNNQRKAFIVEDDIMFKLVPFKLDTGKIQTIKLPANGKTYRIIAEQPEGHPGNSYPTLAIEGCALSSSGSFSTGFVTQYSEDNSNPFVANDCQESVGEGNLNDLRGFPKGYGSEHFVSDTTELQYQIHFYNNTNSTVKHLVVTDTLSSFLDVKTLRKIESNFPYKLAVENNVLIFTLDSLNVAKEKEGAIKFQIRQTPKNPNGTVIKNQASIAFNFGLPLVTNTTIHTVGTNFIKVGTSDVENTIFAKINVFPNPFVQEATFELLEDATKYLNATFYVYTITGELVEKQNFETSKITFQRRNLLAGTYVYRIEYEGKSIGAGKIVISE
jgi:SdrD B-like domain